MGSKVPGFKSDVPEPAARVQIEFNSVKLCLLLAWGFFWEVACCRASRAAVRRGLLDQLRRFKRLVQLRAPWTQQVSPVFPAFPVWARSLVLEFRCAACIEAVSHWHKDMAVRVKEELFFASRWILQLGLRVIEGTYNVKDSTDTDCENYVAQLTASAPQTVRQFMSTDCSSTQSMCLASSSSSPGLVLEDCSEGENQQLLDANEASKGASSLKRVR